MGWKSVKPMEEKAKFVVSAMSELESFAATCRKFGISRKTGYRLISRFKVEGLKALEEQSRRPNRSPTALSSDLVCEIVSIRNGHPSWGAKKILAILGRKHVERELPAVRSVNRVLERCGLIEKKRRRKEKLPYHPESVIRPKGVNDVWTVDFKGYWHTKDRQRCNPLTIRDEHSKFILDIGALAEATGSAVASRFRSCFERYGVPKYIRSDNGAPFSSAMAVAGLSELAAWFISLGILPNRIPKGSPQYNGGHERMHKDMKRELQASPARNLAVQQRIFDEWRREYNEERPHEALRMKTPASYYRNSDRKFISRTTDFIYSEKMLTRKVGVRGEIWWKGQRFFLTNALTHKTVALLPQKDGSMEIWFCDFLIGRASLNGFSPLGGKGSKDRNKLLPMSWH